MTLQTVSADNIRPLAAPAHPSALRSRRIESIDVVRGLAIISILGADQLALAIRGMFGHQDTLLATIGRALGDQFEHAQWEGVRFYDLVFPLFIFITGVSIVFSLGKCRDSGVSADVYSRVVRRALLLYALGVIYYGGFSNLWADLRLVGVLQRIAICYLAASILFLSLQPRELALLFVAILVGYWALFELVSVDEVAAGVYRPEANLAHWVDRNYLPGRRWYGTWDPEGLLSTLPAIATCLLGVLAGVLLKRDDLSTLEKVSLLTAAGVAAIAIGYIWSASFPVIKNLWTSSFVLVAGGFSLLLLGLAHQITAVCGARGALKVTVWMGANAITLYVLNNVVNFIDLAKRVVGGDVAAALDSRVEGAAGLCCCVLGLGIAAWLARYLYTRQIFLRL